MFTLPHTPNAFELFGEGVSSTLVPRVLRNLEEKRDQQQVKKAFENFDFENASPMDAFRKISILPEGPRNTLMKGYAYLQEQKKLARENINAQNTASYLGIPYEEVTGLSSKQIADLARLKATSDKFAPEDIKALENAMIQSGMPKEWASLYAKSTEGGRTAVLKDWLEAKSRLGEKEKPSDNEKIVPISEQPQGKTVSTSEKLEDFDIGLTPRERIARENTRFTTQTPIAQEMSTKLKSLEEESLKLDRLEQLNETGELPEGAGRWNVTVTGGKLRVPAAANPETQLFVKTVNDFTASAKDSYGSRVTNFDLTQFMNRLPTLANTKEGREAIIKQMSIINQLNQLQPRSTLEEIDKYGIRKIDVSKAESLAKKNTVDQKKELINEFNELDGFFDDQEKDLVKDMKSDVPEGYLLMKSPEGKYVYVKKNKVNEKKKEGFKTR